MKLELKAKQKRAPLRSFAEFATEYGLTHAQLRGMMHVEGSPKPVCHHHSNKVEVRYYEVAPFRKWMAGRVA
jgi:hypothetical protein